VLDATPFYAEGGGQQPDTGLITIGGGRVEVLDVQQPVPGLIVHKARIVEGEVRAGETGFAEIDIDRRRAISRAHTATHLVHQTMRNFLGESATQAGSLNAPGRLRFDFNTPAAVPPSVLHDVEQQINEVLIQDLEVRAFITSQAEARAMGAMALFGEKYGDQVRVVEVGEYARSCAADAHRSLGPPGPGEDPLRGLDRVGGAPGGSAGRHRRLPLSRQGTSARFASCRHLPGTQRPGRERVSRPWPSCADAERELEKLRAQLVLGGAGAWPSRPATSAAWPIVGTEAPEGAAVNDVRTLAQEVRGKIPADRPAVVAVASRAGGKASLIVAVNAAAKSRGVSASDLVKGALSGRGGGNADLAQGWRASSRGGAAVVAGRRKGARRGMISWRPGVRLGVDVGTVRVGVARCDPDGILATPLTTIRRNVSDESDRPADMVELARLADEQGAVEVVVGLPINLAGKEGPAAAHIRAYTEKLSAVIAPVPVLLTDERMSTAVAARSSRIGRERETSTSGRRPGGRGRDPSGLARRAAEAGIMIDDLDLAFDDHDDEKGRHRRGVGGRKKRPAKRRGRSWLALFMTLLLLGGLGFGGYVGYQKVRDILTTPDYSGNGNADVVTVEVKQGDTLADIARTLKAVDVVKSEKAFTTTGIQDALKIQPGFYNLHRQMSGKAAVMALLDAKNRVVNGVLVREGLMTLEVFALLADKLHLNVDDFIKAAADPIKLGVPDWWFNRKDGVPQTTPKSVGGLPLPGHV
jgi:putative transcription antitermination factor YqgF